MARRKQKRSPRRRNTAINISNLAEAYIQTSIVTQAATGLTPWNFLTSQEGNSGASKITLNELLTGFNQVHTGTTMTEGELVWKNITDNWMDAGIKTIGVSVGFRLANKLLKKPKRQLNALARTVGVGDMIRI
jgi:hypothetical protein